MENIDELFEKGIEAGENGDFELAIEYFSQFIELKPDDAYAYNNRGLSYANQKNYSEAIKDYDKAIELDPDDALAYNNRGVCYYNQKKYSEAIKDYDKAIELKPDDAYAYNNRGLYYANQKNYSEAIKNYDKAIELKPDYAVAYYNRGVCYYNQKNYSEAIKNYDKAIELDPDYAYAYNNRGLCYYDQKNYSEAIKDYDKAIELDPDDASTYINRGLCYNNQEKYSEAIKDYDKAIELNPDYGLAYNNRGLCFEKGFGDFNSASEDYHCFIHLDDGEFISENLSTLLPFFRDYADAPMVIRQIINKVPALTESIHFQGLIEDVFSKTEPFEEFFKHRQAEAEQRDFLFSEALVYFFLGDYGQPYSIYEQLDSPEIPLNFAQNYYYAQATSIIGKIYGTTPQEIYEDGIEYLNAVSETDFYYLALHHLTIGETEKALQIFEENEAYLPALYQQVIILDNENRPDEKQAIIQKIKQIEADLPKYKGFLHDFSRKLHPNEKDYLSVLIDYAHYSEIEAALRIINPDHKTKPFYQAVKVDFDQLRKDLAKEQQQVLFTKINAEIEAQSIDKEQVQGKISGFRSDLKDKFKQKREEAKQLTPQQFELELAEWIYDWIKECKITEEDFFDWVLRYFAIEGKIEINTLIILHIYAIKCQKAQNKILGIGSEEAILDGAKEILKTATITTPIVTSISIFGASIAPVIGGLVVSYFAKIGVTKFVEYLNEDKNIIVWKEDYLAFKAYFIEHCIEEILKVKSDGFVNSETYKEIERFYEENKYLLG
jgi:tetratricopeptide (TPR) repeat protein